MILTVVFCDITGCQNFSFGEVKDKIFLPREPGWYRKDGQDMCPEHYKKMIALAKAALVVMDKKNGESTHASEGDYIQ